MEAQFAVRRRPLSTDSLIEHDRENVHAEDDIRSRNPISDKLITVLRPRHLLIGGLYLEESNAIRVLQANLPRTL